MYTNHMKEELKGTLIEICDYYNAESKWNVKAKKWGHTHSIPSSIPFKFSQGNLPPSACFPLKNYRTNLVHRDRHVGVHRPFSLAQKKCTAALYPSGKGPLKTWTSTYIRASNIIRLTYLCLTRTRRHGWSSRCEFEVRQATQHPSVPQALPLSYCNNGFVVLPMNALALWQQSLSPTWNRQWTSTSSWIVQR